MVATGGGPSSESMKATAIGAKRRALRVSGTRSSAAAMAALDNRENRGGCLLALRTVAEAVGGLRTVAAEAGIGRESLYRTLSPNGNPTLKTLLAVLKTVGMRLSVEPARHAAA